ncbi:uncharacterized protein DSM5745_05117 [Aspergillus mulundensis]|uniref:Pyruvate decarboxylase n=1 Tax=Aspergillus mulundensis TaxID=1810919 RepID=A0A3D8S5T3_9EURO|nr:hypothetical protein DSM5745_05117 [Aspergillus mulundensis]RDW81560.1 hypothetical protein DSM5745_05117 [Aspergillus mulundensis]
MSNPIQTTLATYLFTRLNQLGIHTVHGVPGDFNIPMLGFIKPAGLHFVESTTELNAAYAADAYARVRGVSALITSYSEGDPTAIPAISRAYADSVPLILIAGVPTISSQMKTPSPKDSIPRPDSWCTRSISSISSHGPENEDADAEQEAEPGKHDFRRFAQLYKPVTAAQASLFFRCAAAKEIDRVLEMCIRSSQPVYIEVPVDMLGMKINSYSLDRPINTQERCNRPHHERSLVQKTVDLLLNATKPLIIIDALTGRFDLANEAAELVRLSGWPVFATQAGKGCIDETLPSFVGIYPGPNGEGELRVASAHNSDWAFARSYLSEANLVIRFGAPESAIGAESSPLPCLSGPDPRRTLDISRRRIRFPGDPSQCTSCEPPNTKDILRGVLDKLVESRHHILLYPHPMPLFANSQDRLRALIPVCPDALIDGETFWPEISHFLKENDVIVTETGNGTGSYTPTGAGTPSKTKNILAGANDLILPANTNMITTSARCGLAASIGVSRASRDRYSQNCGETPRSRTILFIDNRSFKKSAPALQAIFRNKLNLVIFLLNRTKTHSNTNSNTSSTDTEADLSPTLPSSAYNTKKNTNREASIHGTSASRGNPIVLTQDIPQAQNQTCALKVLDAVLSSGAPKRDPLYPVTTRKAATWGQLKHVISDGRIASGRGFSLIDVSVCMPCDFGVHLQLQESQSATSQNSRDSQYEMRYADATNWPLPVAVWQEFARNPFLSSVGGDRATCRGLSRAVQGHDWEPAAVWAAAPLQDSGHTGSSAGESMVDVVQDSILGSIEELESFLEEHMKASSRETLPIEQAQATGIEERIQHPLHVRKPGTKALGIQDQKQKQNNDEISVCPPQSNPQVPAKPSSLSPHLLRPPNRPNTAQKKRRVPPCLFSFTRCFKKELCPQVSPPEESREISAWDTDSSVSEHPEPRPAPRLQPKAQRDLLLGDLCGWSWRFGKRRATD